MPQSGLKHKKKELAMLETSRAYNGMIVTPHRLASQAGISILRRGGHAVEAAIAAAAALCVAYPHMCGLGGDGFWLILPAGDREPIFIDACGRSAQNCTLDWFGSRNLNALPLHGPAAALTVAGAVSGWELALKTSQNWATGHDRLSLSDLFADAVQLAEQGFPVSRHMHELCVRELGSFAPYEAFKAQFLPGGEAPPEGSRMRLPALARTLRRLASEGLDSFYRGGVARDMADDLAAAGSPLSLVDLENHKAEIRSPLALDLECARLFNCPPPTQGLASLIILGILERLARREACDLSDPAMLTHCIVEATKQAFILRKRHIADPAHMTCDPADLLSPGNLQLQAEGISFEKAMPWSPNDPDGDTIWLGVMDRWGNTVSCIQSIYHGFGSAVVLPKTGITWHNRGQGFFFSSGKPNSIGPAKKPLHTLNPAMAIFPDGRIVSYGTMGGDGQPQTQAAVFARYALCGLAAQDCITLPRWVIGRTWGKPSASLKIEENFGAVVLEKLAGLGHTVEPEPAFSSLMGHAGILVRHPEGLLEGGFDPRSDGSVACW